MRPRILIVDDEPNARSALAELLRDEGYEVASVADGLSAKSRIAEFRPDVLITDLHMPVLGGLDLLAAARAMRDGPEVVLMSARPQPRGVTAPFVGKPIDIAKLLSIVEARASRRG